MIDIRFSDRMADHGALAFILDAEADAASLTPLPAVSRNLAVQAARAQRFHRD